MTVPFLKKIYRLFDLKYKVGQFYKQGKLILKIEMFFIDPTLETQILYVFLLFLMQIIYFDIIDFVWYIAECVLFIEHVHIY